MESFVNMMRASFLVFIAIVIIVSGAFIGTFIVPVGIVAFMIYGVYLVIEDDRMNK